MNIAFLFNSDHEEFGGYYGPPIMDKILATYALQRSERQMRVSLGDILTFSAVAQSHNPTKAHLIAICRSVYQPVDFDRLDYDRLDETHGAATVFCWLFQNMGEETADDLHSNLAGDPTYLGAMGVDFSQPLHLQFFRNSLCEEYRLHGRECSVFYEMGMNEDPDLVVRQAFERHGFRVAYEDIGARRTIFDEYMTLEHFERVEQFKTAFAQFSGVTEHIASDLALNIEEIHPKLFDAFAAAAKALSRAETEEEYAQAALSGRRLLERMADSLFPPRKENWNGRKVGKAEYKNRLWAYVEQVLEETDSKDTERLQRLGAEADRLVELFNAGLHASPEKESVVQAFVDLTLWLSEVIEISPEAARRPYLAYGDEIVAFLKQAAERHEPASDEDC